MKARVVSIASTAALLAACATVTSSLHYTRGTDALEQGDFETAIIELEEAVHLDPSLSRNHGNLAYAYLETGRIQDAWVRGRNAVILDPANEYARRNWGRIFVAMRAEVGLEKGDSSAEIRDKLGNPDGTHDASNAECGCIWWQYGYTALSFVNDRLDGTQDMVFQPR